MYLLLCIGLYLIIGNLFHMVIFREKKPDISTYFKPEQELYSKTEGFRQRVEKHESGFVHCSLEIEPFAPLAFGKYASAELSMEGTETTRNNILIRFRRPGGEDLQAVSVPASNGAIYTVLLRGFAQETVRRIKKDNETSVGVTVLPDLRCSVRRVFY